jgi:diaminopimelate epimerase
MRFTKYHALGNDYIVLDPADFPSWTAPTQAQVRVICHRGFGVGSDGVLWGPLPSSKADFALRIFNPDGSEAEKSGNGLRIFSRYLWDTGRAPAGRLRIETPGGVVEASRRDEGGPITVDMGCVSFDSRRIPVAGAPREVINEEITAGGRRFTFCAATIGNPHCVLPVEDLSPELARRFGPEIEVDPRFPNRTNVQFMRVIDRSAIQIEIWERGAGYTLASGSSSSAAAAVAHRLGLVDRSVTVRMPGGSIAIEIGDKFSIRMTGTVNRVAQGTMDAEMFKVAP